MFETSLSIRNKTGLHARPASQLTQLCQKYDCDIRIIHNNNEINPKSIISILASGISKGSSIILQVAGQGEEEAGKAIVELIENFRD